MGWGLASDGGGSLITFFKVGYVCNFKERLGNYGAEATQRAVFDMS